MVAKTPKIIHTVGKRKTAVARVTFKLREKENNNIEIKINSVPLNFWGTENLRWRIREVIYLCNEYVKDILPKYKINVNVKGSGLVSQAEAIRQALAKGLLKLCRGKKLEEILYSFDPWLLKRDYRMNEPHHSSGKGASSRGSRRHKQRSKR
ncbi:MAG: 30S ribosomal protein S9 [Candidatus Aenigmatarchaeota archaeon]